MNTKSIIKFSLIAAALAGVSLTTGCSNSSSNDIDLNAVLDVTVNTIDSYQETLNEQESSGQMAELLKEFEEQDTEAAKAEMTFTGLATALATGYSTAQPPLHSKAIGVSPQTDASLLAFEDLNNNGDMDQGEDALFLIEIDGEKQRIIATSRSGAVNDHHFSGTGLLAGYLIGSMLSRQRGAGVSSSSLASKKPVTAKAAARARAGSGSHSKGK